MTRMAIAATVERSPATCQLVSAHALIAAPPVENSSAAPTMRRRCVRGEAAVERDIGRRFLPNPSAPVALIAIRRPSSTVLFSRLRAQRFGVLHSAGGEGREPALLSHRDELDRRAAGSARLGRA